MTRALTAALLLFTGCVYGRGHAPEEPFDIERELSQGGEASTGDMPAASAPYASRELAAESWWQSFGVDELDALERRAAESAPDLRSAEARLLRAQALATQAGAARYPTVGVSGSLSLGRSISPVGGAIDSRSASFSLPIAWEVDLFARRVNGARAARANARASQADADGVALSLQAQVAEAYFDLLEVRSRRALLSEDREADARTSELVRLRFARGLASAVDVQQASQQEIADDAQLSLLLGAETSAKLRLAALLGVLPSTLPELTGSSLPSPPPPLARGAIRADMLRARPDLRAARLRVSAADSSVGAALGARLPTIQLSLTPGYSSLHSESSFGSSTSTGYSYNAAASLNAPLFDGFLGRGRVEEQRANVLEAQSGYERLLLGALVEVDSSLALELDERAHRDALLRSVEVAEHLVSSAQDRFRLGLSDFLPVLGALRGRTGARLALLASERRLISLRVTLHRAVGGSLPAPVSPSPEQEQEQ